jgi:hypothetical protein
VKRMVKALLCATALVASGAVSALVIPADAVDESDPRVVAAYIAQCTEWSKENPWPDQQAYISGCVEQAALVWPVGLDPDAADD